MPLTSDGLINYMQDRLGVEISGVGNDTPLFSSGLLDSFSIVELMGFIESSAAIRMDPWDVTLDNLDSIDRILAYVQTKQG